MADRHRRTGVSIGQTTNAPTERTQVVANQVPTIRPSTEGLEGLSQVFSNFFGGIAKNLDQLNQIEQFQEQKQHARDMMADKVDIKAEQDRLTKAGLSDAAAGRDMDPANAAFQHYVDAFDTTKGEAFGAQLVADWQEQVLAKATPGSDLKGATEAWIKQEVGNGTGNATHDAAALSIFNGVFKKSLVAHSQNSVKAQLALGQQELGAHIASVVRSDAFEAQDVNRWIERAKALDPMNPAAAPLTVINSILTATDGNEHSIKRVIAGLNKPGTGVNGKSFFESFPAAREFEAKAYQKFATNLTFEGARAYDGLQERAAAASTVDDLASVMSELEMTKDRYGGQAHYEAIKKSLAPKIDKMVTSIANVNSVTGMMQGALPRDVSHLKKFQGEWLAQAGLDAFAKPTETAAAVTKMGVVSDDLRSNISLAISDFTNPTRQAQAFQFLAAAQGRMGEDWVVQNLDDHARDTYQALHSMWANDQANLSQHLLSLKENLPAIKQASKVSWKDITGARDEMTAQADVRSEITSALKSQFGNDGGWFNSTITVDPAMMEELMRQTKIAALRRGRDGVGSMEDITKATVKAFGDRFEVLPGENGSHMLRRRDRASVDPATGEELVRPGLQVFNPNTREYENTVDTFRKDGEALSAVASGIIQSAKELSVDGNSPFSARGVYLVKSAGQHVTFEPGQTIRVNGQDQALSKEPGLAATRLRELFPHERFTLIPWPAADAPQGFLLGYRFGFVGKLKSIDEKEAEWKAPAVPPKPADDFGIISSDDPLKAMQEASERERQRIKNRKK